MFTGIIEEVGIVTSITKNKIIVKAKTVLRNTNIGDSIAVNGICLTVTEISIYNGYFVADISPETNKVTVLKNLQSGSIVNLERAMPVDGRFGGHFVSGHIDCIGKFKDVIKEGDFYNIKIEVPENYIKYIAKKGSIAIDGISLTVADIDNNTVSVAMIPHTFENTNFKMSKIGDYVNIETDILAKYVEKFLSTSDNKTGISMEFLMEHGF